jgi:tetratricopeptide (TPR) repeat protein
MSLQTISGADTLPNTSAESHGDASIDQVREAMKNMINGGTYAAAIDFDEKKAESLYALGHAQYSQGHYTEAMRFFGSIMTYEPLNYRAMQAMAACMQMAGKYGQALLLLGILLVAQEDNKEISLQIIHCLVHLGRYSEAMKVIDAVQMVLDKNTENVRDQQRLDGYRQIAERAIALS